MTLHTLILPGLGNSGPDHWQSQWERRDPGFRRVLQDDWDSPDCAAWVARLSRELAGVDTPVLLAAHSAACALTAHWAAGAGADIAKVRGALLVAPSDPSGPNYPAGPRGFNPVPLRRLPFPSIVVASDNDPYVSLQRAREYATAWGSSLVVLEKAGHINVASGHRVWPEGFALLDTLRNSATLQDSREQRLRQNA